MNKKKLTVAMAGGGSGGHVYPIKSLIEFAASHKEFRGHIDVVYWFGQRHKLEEKEFLYLDVQKKLICRFVPILSGKIRRQKTIKAWLKNIRDIFLFVAGIFQSVYFIKKYKVDVIFCKGGYVAAPVVLAGAILRKKIIAHESDTHPGLSSRVALPFAKYIFTGFDDVLPEAETIGQILSDKILFNPKDLKNRNKLLQDPVIEKILSLDKNKTIILVLGGSLGSKTLYEKLSTVLYDHLEWEKKIHFIVVGGFLNTNIADIFKDFSHVTTFDYLSQKQMGMVCYYADIGFTRAGTTSLAEQKLYGLKLLISPIPRTHDQYDNAKYYVNHYGAILIDQQKDFEKELGLTLDLYKDFKKEINIFGILDEIRTGKNLVWKKMLDL